jgi:hypothetical protein
LTERVQLAREGRGDLVIVSGDAGIGKSALLEAFGETVLESGCQVLSGRAWEFADAPAYFPLRAGLRALGVTPAIPAASDSDAFGLWEDVLGALTQGAPRSPIVWILEDMHAADAQTLELLAFLAQPLRNLPALFLISLRSSDPRASGPAIQRLTRLTRASSRITLGPLAALDVTALAAEVSGSALPEDALDAWMARTGGNPLFVVECARAVRAGRSLQSALPDTVVELVAERLRGQAAATRQYLENGAVLGRDFSAASVARMTQGLPSVVIEELLPALRAGILEERAPGRFRFTHALVRDAIEQTMAADVRRSAHAWAVDALAELGETTEVVVERARHAVAALGVIAESTAQELVSKATAALDAEGARDRAFALWQRWMDVRSGAPDSAVLLELARLATAAGFQGEADAAAERAGALAKSAGDPERVARAALARAPSPLPGVRDAAHVRALEEALAGLDAAKTPSLVYLLQARLAAALQPAADPSAPVALARETIARARALDDPALLREVLVYAGSALTAFVDTAETRVLASELLSVALATGDSSRALRALSRLQVAELELSAFEAFDADAERMLSLAREAGHPALTWRPLLVLSMRALARGEFEESERFVAELEQAAMLLDDPALVLTLKAHRAYATFAIDDENAMRTALANDVPELSVWAGELGTPALRAMFGLRLEDRKGVAAVLPGLARFARLMSSESPMLGFVGEAFALAGSKEEREEWLAKLRPLESLQVTSGPIPQTYEGPMRRVLGLLEASLGRFAQANGFLESARQLCRAHRLAPWVARLSLERARVQMASGGVESARALFEEAARTAAELGMRGIEGKALAALGESRPVASSSVPRPGAPEQVRLAREGEVWRVSWGSHVVRVKDSRGVELLARLVAAAGERIHVLALAGDSDAALPESSAGDASDRRAVAAYRSRLAAIDNSLAAAESGGVRGRSQELRREREILLAEISRAIGLGGRLRRVGSATERARVAVTRRLKDAVARIAEVDPVLGQHLRDEVRTGTYCVYFELVNNSRNL